MADTNQIIFAFPELRILAGTFKAAGEALRVEKRELSVFSGKSDVLDKYAELYKTLCDAIEAYCDLVAHDFTSIDGVIKLIEAADIAASGNVNNGLFIFGAGGGVPSGLSH